ncbi:phage major capsid protein [Thalassospira sp.]|uniref:phage major capsid protein n=1 Tax=Thalassospira sp. TaxID=1912094 RepID=UPI001B0B6D67|nr:phage major capsid protein [Thalassospira sp.]MBO6807268.1 phage major capsid protein [Thalassospira sp.]MBO6841675.1 phage major capsid protein [Thalassospira sp.]
MTDITTLIESVEDFQKSAKVTIDELREKLAGANDRIHDLEQRSYDSFVPTHGTAKKTFADQIVNNDRVQDVASKKAQRTALTVKAADLLETKSTTTSATQAVTTGMGIVGAPDRVRYLRELFPQATSGTGTIEYSRQTSANPTAGNQASEGSSKDEATLTFELKTATLPTLAHYTKASRQAMSDAAMLQSFIDAKLRAGLNRKLDANIIASLTNSGDYTAFTPTSGGDQIVNVRYAIAALEALDANPTHILINPSDARGMDLLTDNEGNYILGGAALMGGDTQNVWSVRVFKSNAVTAGKLLVVDPASAGVFVSCQEASVEIGYTGSDFTANLVTILAEMRGDLIVGSEKAVCYGDLTA